MGSGLCSLPHLTPNKSGARRETEEAFLLLTVTFQNLNRSPEKPPGRDRQLPSLVPAPLRDPSSGTSQK